MTMETYQPPPIERDSVQGELAITPDSLTFDNRSDRAKELSAKWQENRNNGNLWAVVACGDARVLIPKPENIISIRSIATGGKKENRIFESQGVKLIVVMSHIDGDTIAPGKKPRGCGGSAAKEESLNGNGEKNIEGISHYIENNIEHPDPIVQATISAKKLTKLTGKPSLAIIQDHLTGKMYPVATFLKGYDIVSGDIDWIGLLRGYNEAEIYANGIPTLSETVIPKMFCEFLDAGREHMNDMLRTYPSLKDLQKIQNPRMVVISSKLPSVRIRYPQITSIPGSIFKLHMPRKKNGLKINVSPSIQREIVNQAQYPLEHAVKHFDKPGEPFSRTDRVLIETSDINISRALAARLAKRLWMEQWLARPDHLILVIQSIEGVSNIIEPFS